MEKAHADSDKTWKVHLNAPPPCRNPEPSCYVVAAALNMELRLTAQDS